MDFTSKVAYCKIAFSHKGEVDFTKDLNLPIVFESVLDETLDTATIKLTDLRKADYPKIDVSKAFEPFSLVRIGFEGQQTEIRMLIAHDDCKLKRKNEGLYKSWSHTVQLVEETKQLERESVDVLTFTNPVERNYESTADAEWTQNYAESYSINIFGQKMKQGTWQSRGWQPITLKMCYNKGDKLVIGDNLHTYSKVKSNSEYIRYLTLTVTDPMGKERTYSSPLKTSYDKDANKTYYVDGDILELQLDHAGEYKLTLHFFRQDYYYMESIHSTYIAVRSNNELIKNYTINEVLTRTLNLTPLRKANDPPKYKFDPVQLAEYDKEESPEFAFTGHTLFEAMLLVAQYKGAFPKLKSDTISFRTLWNGKTLTETDLPPAIEEINSSDINQYCTYLETEVQNLVGLNNSRMGTIIEPYAGGFKTTRSGGGSEISEDTAVIHTHYNVYQNIALNMGYTDGTLIGDITPFVYEQGEYNSLSDTSGAYPNSKAYALEWSQMGKNYTELAHRIKSTASSIGQAFTDPSIANIIYAKTGKSRDSEIVTYLKNLVGIKGNDSFAELMFRAEYVPIFNARIKQYKECFKEFHHDGSIKYNQTAELVDSEMYGEHLKQLIRKIGNETKRCVYIFDKIDDVPEVGTVVDGYSIYDVQMSVRENEVVATVFYVKYAELSKYIGVKNAWKDSDVSTNKCYNRAISYNEFLLFTHSAWYRGHLPVSETLSAEAIRQLVDFTSANPLTCVEATGHYADGSPLNTVLLPVISLAVGNSLLFQWGYLDNYSAGYMSDRAPEGAISAISGTKYNRAQKAVKYCDMYGRIETYDFKIMRSGPVPNGSNIGWQNVDGAIEYSAEYVTRQIGYSLPLKPLELIGWESEEYITVNDLLVEKNSSEALTFSVQLHYCTADENFIIGSGLTNFCSLIGGEAQETALFGFKERINIFKRRFSIGNAIRLFYNDVAASVSRPCGIGIKANGDVEITLSEYINDKNGDGSYKYNSWAYMGKDKNGNWQIIFGENRDMNNSAFKTKLYLLPIRKLEDFI